MSGAAISPNEQGQGSGAWEVRRGRIGSERSRLLEAHNRGRPGVPAPRSAFQGSPLEASRLCCWGIPNSPLGSSLDSTPVDFTCVIISYVSSTTSPASSSRWFPHLSGEISQPSSLVPSPSSPLRAAILLIHFTKIGWARWLVSGAGCSAPGRECDCSQGPV